MRKKANTEAAVIDKEETVKPRGGRKAMSPEEKEAAAKARALEKEKAQNMHPEVFVQYQGGEISVDALTEAAKEAFHAEKKRTLVTGLRLYVKPEEKAAYYVINGEHEGKITF